MSYYSSGYGPPGTAASSDPNLAFYSTPAGQPSFYSSEPSSAHHEPLARTDLSGAIGGGAQGGRGAGAGAGAGGGAGTGAGAAFGGQITVQNWWNAFTPWTGMDGEPPLLEGAPPSLALGSSSC